MITTFFWLELAGIGCFAKAASKVGSESKRLGCDCAEGAGQNRRATQDGSEEVQSWQTKSLRGHAHVRDGTQGATQYGAGRYARRHTPSCTVRSRPPRTGVHRTLATRGVLDGASWFDPDLFRACWSTHQGFLGLFISRLGLFRSSNFIHRRKGCHNLRRTSQCLESQQTQNPSHDQFTLHREEGARRTRVRWFSTHCFDSSTDAFILPLFC